MKSIKNLMTILLIFTLFMSNAAAVAEVQSKSIDSEISLLSQLSLLPDNLEASPNFDKPMKRATFAHIFAKVLNLNINASNDVIIPDVNNDLAEYLSICAMKRSGYMTGDENGMFLPDDKITYGACLKVIMTALGYGDIANYYGGYPTGYIKLAHQKKVADGININGFNDNISYGDVLKLIENMLETKMLSITSINEATVSIDDNDSKTFLETYHGISIHKGIVYGVYGKQAKGNDLIDKNEIQINDKKMKISEDKDCSKYFGMSVKYYFDDDSKKVLALKKYEEDNNTTTLLCEDIETLKNREITYYKGDKLSKILLDANVIMVYNGMPCVDFSQSDFAVGDGSVTFIDNNSDSKIDICDITKLKNIVVKATKASDKTVYDMYGNERVSVPKNEIIIFKDEFGNDMDFNELFQYDVLSVFQSKNKKITKILYSNKEVRGRIEEKGNDGYFYIGSKKYKAASNFKTKYNAMKVGDSGVFILDCYGNVASYNPNKSIFEFGYLIDVRKDKGIDPKSEVKIMNESGKINIYTAADKIYINGKQTEGKNLYELITANGELKQQVIRFWAFENVLKSIDTLDKGDGGSDDRLTSMYACYGEGGVETNTLLYNGYQNIFGTKVPADGSTKVFVVPYEASNVETDYNVKSLSYFTHDRGYAINAYCAEEDGHIADVILRYGSVSSIDNKTPITYISHVSEAISDSGEYTYRIYGIRDGVFVSNLVKDPEKIDNLQNIAGDGTHKLACGDVAKFSIDTATDEIVETTVLYEKDTDTLLNNCSISSDIENPHRMMRASAYSVKSGILRLTQEDLSKSGVKLTPDSVESINLSMYKIYKYTVKNGKSEVEVATSADIVDYLSSESDYTKLMMFSAYNDPGILIIY